MRNSFMAVYFSTANSHTSVPKKIEEGKKNLQATNNDQFIVQCIWNAPPNNPYTSNIIGRIKDIPGILL